MKMFSVKDVKAEGFNRPFFELTFGLAERAFKEAAKDQQNPMHKHAEDFSLWYTGDFDQKTGVFTPVQPQLICSAV